VFCLSVCLWFVVCECLVSVYVCFVSVCGCACGV